MALLTTVEIKEYLKITDNIYDTDIAKYEPVAEARLNDHVGYTITTLNVGYHPDYARLVWLYISEASTTLQSGNVKSQSFDGESVTFGDSTNKDIAKTSVEQLLKFNPLRKKYW